MFSGDADNTQFTLPRFCEAFNEGMADITNSTKYFVKVEFATIPGNYNSLDFSNKASEIYRVDYSSLADNRQSKLVPIGFDQLDDIAGLNWRTNDSSGEPIYYVTNKQNPCNFFVYPMVNREASAPRFGIIEDLSRVSITSEFGTIEGQGQPFLRIIYAELQRRIVPSEDGNSIVFEGTNMPAMFNMQDDVAYALKHYCLSLIMSISADEIKQRLSANHLALYNRTLKQIKRKKAAAYNDDITPGHYNNGFSAGVTGIQGRNHLGNFGNAN